MGIYDNDNIIDNRALYILHFGARPPLVLGFGLQENYRSPVGIKVPVDKTQYSISYNIYYIQYSINV